MSGAAPPRPAAITIRPACEVLAVRRRHLGAPRGHRFSTATAAGDDLLGVVIVGRPVTPVLNDGSCTTGHANGCTVPLGAARRPARAMGCRRMLTQTRVDGPGGSQHAGWPRVGIRPARSGRHAPSRPRIPRGADRAVRVLWLITGAPGTGPGGEVA